MYCLRNYLNDCPTKTVNIRNSHFRPMVRSVRTLWFLGSWWPLTYIYQHQRLLSVFFFYRCSWSSSEASSSQQESRSRNRSVDSTPDSLSRCREMSLCSSFDTVGGSRVDLDSEKSTRGGAGSSKVDPVRVSVTRPLIFSEQSLYNEDSVCSSDSYSQDSLVLHSRTSSDESSTPVASIAGSRSSSTTNLHDALKDTQSADTKSSSGVLQTSDTPSGRGSRMFSANRITRQLSVGDEGSCTGVQHYQNYYPFPNRKTPRISEAAKRLGMYASL